MKMIRLVSFFLARVFLSILFLGLGIKTIFYWQQAEQQLLNSLCDWQMYAGHFLAMQECMAALVPWSEILLGLALLLELAGSLMILFGYRAKLGALLLIFLLIPGTLILHPFWFLEEGGGREIQAALFFKNLAILGGLMLAALFGVHPREE